MTEEQGNEPTEEQVQSRSSSIPEETSHVSDEDAEASAKRVLEESAERTEDPATVDLDDDSVERRKADELVVEDGDGGGTS